MASRLSGIVASFKIIEILMYSCYRSDCYAVYRSDCYAVYRSDCCAVGLKRVRPRNLSARQRRVNLWEDLSA